ncbi:unnamed protein product [Camellia sinensis]
MKPRETKMGSRRRGGGGGDGSPSTVFERVLCRRIESCKSNHATVDELVAYLRMNFPQYGRHKLQPFTRTVQQTLEHHMKSKKTIKSSSPGRPSTSNHHEHEDNHRPARKKTKRIDSSDERLQQSENQHIRMNQRGQSTSSLEWVSEPADGTDGAVSIFEDAVCGQKFEPEFDLMMSMLRDRYSESKDATKKVDLFGGDSGFGKRDAQGFSGGGEEEEVTGKDGLRFRDLGGMEGVVEELKMEVIVPLYHPQLPKWLGVRPMAGILLHGPPGCGKTKLAHAIANETGVPFYKISATELVSGISCASEENIRELFAKEYRTTPSIVFIDKIDAIASKRENLRREMERRIVTQLMTCMDESHRLVQPVDVDPNAESSNSRLGYVLVIGATNRPDVVDPTLRSQVHARVCWSRLGSLANKAGNFATKRIIDRRKSEQSREPIDENHIEDWWGLPWLPEEMENLSITMADFEEAAKLMIMRDLGLIWRQDFCFMDLRAVGPELPNRYVGGSELAVRTIFSRARTCSPCILFFDEVDALTTKHGKEGGWVVEWLLNQLLVELDGAEQQQGVYVIGATNRPVVMDRAVLQPGSMNEAAMAALEEKLIARSCSSDATSLTIKKMHFEQALEKISPSVSSKI